MDEYMMDKNRWVTAVIARLAREREINKELPWNRWRAERDGHFEKGSAPWNAGAWLREKDRVQLVDTYRYRVYCKSGLTRLRQKRSLY